VIVLGLPLTYLAGGRPLQGATAGFSAATWAVLYFTVTGAAMGMLRLAFPDQVGIKLVILHCLTIWGGDSGAYYFGSRFGRHRMAPRISPKKSWEGLAAGAAATFFGVWVCRTVFFGELPLGLAVTLAGVLAVAAPLGDLLESLMKRDVGVKDSSGLIPGHGGFLDRTDSVFFAAPLVVATVLLWGNPW
jgi:phosphatidate cytidylyltransferase